MTATITCECGKIINISSYLNQDLLLICDDLSQKLELVEKENLRLKEKIEDIINEGYNDWW